MGLNGSYLMIRKISDTLWKFVHVWSFWFCDFKCFNFLLSHTDVDFIPTCLPVCQQGCLLSGYSNQSHYVKSGEFITEYFWTFSGTFFCARWRYAHRESSLSSLQPFRSYSSSLDVSSLAIYCSSNWQILCLTVLAAFS